MGDVVLDLGAGTGILGLLACGAGARRVYAIDRGPVIELAREVAAGNGFADRIVFVNAPSTRVDLPERVDVVIADQLGPFGVEAGLLESFSDACARFLVEGGRLIPRQVNLEVAPVECPDVAAAIDFWERPAAGLDFSSARTVAASSCHVHRLEREHLLGEPATIASIDVAGATAGPFRCETRLHVDRPGILHGIGGWFSAHLSQAVTMSNSPLASRRIDRANAVFPIGRAVPVEKSDTIDVVMHIHPEAATFAWTVEIRRRDGTASERFAHSTLQGTLLSRDGLRRTRPDATPRLCRWGDATSTVLRLCDGRNTLSEIEQAVSNSYPELFQTRDRAAAFVAEVVGRHTA